MYLGPECRQGGGGGRIGGASEGEYQKSPLPSLHFLLRPHTDIQTPAFIFVRAARTASRFALRAKRAILSGRPAGLRPLPHLDPRDGVVI